MLREKYEEPPKLPQLNRFSWKAISIINTELRLLNSSKNLTLSKQHKSLRQLKKYFIILLIKKNGKIIY